jgi:hypothetical protein
MVYGKIWDEDLEEEDGEKEVAVDTTVIAAPKISTNRFINSPLRWDQFSETHRGRRALDWEQTVP